MRPIIVAAAGNSGQATSVFPACYDKCIAVTGVTYDLELAPLSVHADWVDVAAPGFKVFTTLAGGGYGYESGTSFAAASVSGLASLLYSGAIDQNDDGRNNDEVRRFIENGCQKLAVDGTGYGLIDVNHSIGLLDATLLLN